MYQVWVLLLFNLCFVSQLVSLSRLNSSFLFSQQTKGFKTDASAPCSLTAPAHLCGSSLFNTIDSVSETDDAGFGRIKMVKRESPVKVMTNIRNQSTEWFWVGSVSLFCHMMIQCCECLGSTGTELLNGDIRSNYKLVVPWWEDTMRRGCDFLSAALWLAEVTVSLFLFSNEGWPHWCHIIYLNWHERVPLLCYLDHKRCSEVSRRCFREAMWFSCVMCPSWITLWYVLLSFSLVWCKIRSLEAQQLSLDSCLCLDEILRVAAVL